MEPHYILLWNTTDPAVGYNISTGGFGGNTGVIPSDETCKKLSEANRGKKLPPRSEEHRRKIGEANHGKKHSEEIRRKISEAHRGKKLSEETRRKMSESARNRRKS